LNDNGLLTGARRLRFNFLLRTRRQSSGSLSFRAHTLNCCHHIILLSKKCVPEIRSPLNVLGEFCDHIWKRR
jgi:hypothetical protein